MISTPELIAALAARPKPVRRLGSPLRRAAAWLALAGLLMALIAVGHKLRPGLAGLFAQSDFRVTFFAAVATGALAAIAAFLLSMPDRSRLWALLPAPAFLLWQANIGYQCLTNWVSFGPAGMGLGETADCFATLVLIGLPLGLAAFVMLRHAAYFSAIGVALLASLAVSGITSAAMSLFHPLDASVLILGFNVGSTLLIIAVGAALGLQIRSHP